MQNTFASMKTFLFGLAIAAMPALSFAQGFQIGVKGGVNLSKLTFGEFVSTNTNANGSPSVDVNGQTLRNSISDSYQSKTGTSFGIYTRFGKNLFIQPELMYTTREGQFDVIRNGVDPRFELSRYGESLASSTPSFDPLRQALEGPPTLIDSWLDEITRSLIETHKPDLVGLTAPFPGNVYGAFRMARACKAFAPAILRMCGSPSSPTTPASGWVFLISSASVPVPQPRSSTRQHFSMRACSSSLRLKVDSRSVQRSKRS